MCNKIHTPIKGLRVRLRMALKAAGITQKFKTTHNRAKVLVVSSSSIISLPFTEFEGYPVQFIQLGN